MSLTFPIVLAVAGVIIFPALGVAGHLRERLRLGPEFTFASVMLVLGAAAEATFFLTMVNHHLAEAVVAAGVAVGLWTTARTLRQAALRRALAEADSWMPFAVTFAAALGYAALLGFAVPHTDAVSTETMLWLQFAVDNVIPHWFAGAVAAHAPPEPFIPGWQSSDRPPLQAGFDLLFAPLLPTPDPLARYQAIGMLLQATACGAFCTLSRVAGASRRRCCWSVALATCSGFFFANTAFVWPKLLSATFVTLAVALVLNTRRIELGRAVAAGVGIALGLLSHGGVIFAFPALLVAWLVRDGKAALRPLAAVIATVVLVSAPWSWYVRVYDPPGDRLLKWHLAGQIAVSPERFWPTFVHAYTTVAPQALLENRLDNFATLAGLDTPYRLLRTLSLQQRQLRVVPYALGVLIVPYIAAFFFVRSRRPLLRTAGAFAWISLGANVCWALAMYNPSSTLIHLGSYETMLIMFFAASCVATEWLALFVPLVVAQAIYFGAGWLPTFAFADPLKPIWWCDVAILVALTAAAVALQRRVGLASSPTFRR